MKASHRLHHNADFRIIQDNIVVMNKHLLHRVSGKIPQIQNIFDFNLIRCFFVYRRMVFFNYLYHSGTDSSISENSNFYHTPVSSLSAYDGFTSILFLFSSQNAELPHTGPLFDFAEHSGYIALLRDFHADGKRGHTI